jgi:hypothetical protein
MAKILEASAPASLSNLGTCRWSAPETMRASPVWTEKADIYSLGMTFYEIATRCIPFHQVVEPVVVSLVTQKERPHIPRDTPSNFAELITGCWEHDPSMRPPLSHIIKTLEEIATGLADSPRSLPVPRKRSTLFFEINKEELRRFVPNYITLRECPQFPGLPTDTCPRLPEEVCVFPIKGSNENPLVSQAYDQIIFARVEVLFRRFYTPHDPSLKVTLHSVDVIFNEEVENRFRQAEEQLHDEFQGLAELKDEYQSELQRYYLNKLITSDNLIAQRRSNPISVWHGTDAKYLESIYWYGMLNLSSTDEGYFGKGLYLTQQPKYGEHYAQQFREKHSTSKFCLVLCWALVGRPWAATKVAIGSSREPNYTSHFSLVTKKPVHPECCATAEDFERLRGATNYFPVTTPGEEIQGDEIVLFNSSHVFPRYVVHYTVERDKGGPSTRPNSGVGPSGTNPTSAPNKPPSRIKHTHPPLKHSDPTPIPQPPSKSVHARSSDPISRISSIPALKPKPSPIQVEFPPTRHHKVHKPVQNSPHTRALPIPTQRRGSLPGDINGPLTPVPSRSDSPLVRALPTPTQRRGSSPSQIEHVKPDQNEYTQPTMLARSNSDTLPKSIKIRDSSPQPAFSLNNQTFNPSESENHTTDPAHHHHSLPASHTQRVFPQPPPKSDYDIVQVKRVFEGNLDGDLSHFLSPHRQSPSLYPAKKFQNPPSPTSSSSTPPLTSHNTTRRSPSPNPAARKLPPSPSPSSTPPPSSAPMRRSPSPNLPTHKFQGLPDPAPSPSASTSPPTAPTGARRIPSPNHPIHKFQDLSHPSSPSTPPTFVRRIPSPNPPMSKSQATTSAATQHPPAQNPPVHKSQQANPSAIPLAISRLSRTPQVSHSPRSPPPASPFAPQNSPTTSHSPTVLSLLSIVDEVLDVCAPCLVLPSCFASPAPLIL